MSEIAVLMAAGLGTRMRPVTEKIPKPLVKVGKVAMIETIIEAFQKRGMDEIIIVTGYLKEQFEYLKDKYANVTLVENHDYKKMNNLSSVYAVVDKIEENNCFICEADLYISNSEIFCQEFQQSCYMAKWIEGYSADWVFDMAGNRISHIHKGASDAYNMTGISYFKREDAKKIGTAIRNAYGKKGHENLFWDEIVDTLLNDINVTVYPIQQNEIIEIDTIEELECIRDKVGKIVMSDK